VTQIGQKIYENMSFRQKDNNTNDSAQIFFLNFTETIQYQMLGVSGTDTTS